jgi:glycosyltransferase involved in cell wall biosynthesis
MKILHVINNLAAGGAELQLLSVCREMTRMGVEIIVACLREDGKGSRLLRGEFESLDIQVVRLVGGGRYNVWFPADLVRLIARVKPDVIHTHLPRADWAGAIAKGFCRKTLVVSSVHDIHAFWAGRWTMPLCDWAWRRADAIVAISEAVRRWLINSRGIPEAKISLIRYGVESKSRAANGREDYETPDTVGGPVIGSIGRLELRKGHDCLIRAMPMVLRAVPGACLAIAGGDPWGFRRHLQRLINELNLNNHVRLVGFEADIESFMRRIDVFAFASRIEGLGQVILEAMQARKPIVASRIPAISEIISHGETGLLATPDDEAEFARAIVHLLRDRDFAYAMAERARRCVEEEWRIEDAARRIRGLYGRLSAR